MTIVCQYTITAQKKNGCIPRNIHPRINDEDRGNLNGTMTRNMSQQPNLPTKKKLLIRELPDA